MALVACHIAEVEDDLWYDWSEELQRGLCLGSVWEFEPDSYGEKTVWDLYDQRCNFPTVEAPGGLAREIMAEMRAEFCTSEEEEETPTTPGPPPGSPFPKQPGPVLALATGAGEIPRPATTPYQQAQTNSIVGFPSRASPKSSGPSHQSAPDTLATGVPIGPPVTRSRPSPWPTRIQAPVPPPTKAAPPVPTPTPPPRHFRRPPQDPGHNISTSNHRSPRTPRTGTTASSRTWKPGLPWARTLS